MNFSTDRDLLALEPTLFNDVVFASQKRLEIADGVVSGSALTSATGNFENAQIEAGDVVLIAGSACEVMARVNATTLTISRLRSLPADAAIPPGNGSSLAVIHRTFGPQARAAHDELLRMLGIDPDGTGDVTQDAIVSLSVMRELESLLALALIFEAAVTLASEENNGVFRAKAAEYRQRLRRACRSSRVAMDLDGDGIADTVRDLSILELVRV